MGDMSAAEFRKKYKVTGGFVDARSKAGNDSKNTRAARALCEDNGASEVRKQAIQAISNLSADCQTDFFNSPINLTIKVRSKTKADGDNIYKGLADSLQGYAFENDKQIRSGTFGIYDD